MKLRPELQKTIASTYLKGAGKFWFITATIGLFGFGMYVILYYATTAASNRFEIWNKNLFSGIIPGESLGNMLLVGHILLASVILFGGPIQFMPFVRNRFRVFHRWVGRIYLTLAVVICLSGVIMTILGKSFGSIFLQVVTSLSAIYICWFAIMTIKNAMAKKFQTHRRWALRLFMLANGVWFIRVWPNAWKILTNNLPDSYPEKTVAFFTYILPLQLVLLELYFFALKKNQPRLQWFTTTSILVFTLIMAIGIYGTMTGWLHKIQKVY